MWLNKGEFSFYSTAFSLVCCVIVLPAYAQELEFASSPNPVGSGARALGMGGGAL